MVPWLALLETWAVQQLLRTPGFHRGVEKVAKTVHRYRNNLPPEQPGGTAIDDPNKQSFVKHYFEEVQTQLGRAERREAQSHHRQSGTPLQANKSKVVEEVDESAEGAWREMSAGMKQKNGADGDGNGGAGKSAQGFLGEYVDALRQQIRNGK